MRYTFLLPLAAAAYVLLYFAGFLTRPRVPEPRPDRGVFLPARVFPLTRGDILPLLLLTLGYAAAAFFLLGSTEAPESFLSLDAGESAVIALEEPAAPAVLLYYTGLDTGDYTLEVTRDGETWTAAGALAQDYAGLFRWHSETLDCGEIMALRLTAERAMELGEILLLDGSGQRLTVSGGALTDEQETWDSSRLSWYTGSYFDEIYHVRTAREMLTGHSIYETTHPPLGKLIIALGIALFGMNPFGWRFMGTLFGVLMLPLLYLLIRNMFGCRDAAICGTAVFALDFMHYTQTRLATIDTYAVFFILLAALGLYRWLVSGGKWALALCGAAFGLGTACKWTVLYAGAGMGLLWLLRWLFRRGEPDYFRRLGKNILWCLLWFVAVPGLIYYLSYIPYGRAVGLTGPEMLLSPRYLHLVLKNQADMFAYHSTLVAEHPYASRWWQWLLDLRPILYYLEYIGEDSKSAFGAFNAPLLSWAGLLAVLWLGWDTVKRRDGRSLFVLVGYLAGLLPWVGISRLTFAYHYFPCTLWLALAMACVFARDTRRAPMVGFTAASGGLFAAFYPVLSGVAAPRWYTTALLHWFSTWPF